MTKIIIFLSKLETKVEFGVFLELLKALRQELVNVAQISFPYHLF